jgi:HK97 family phage portal protein
MANTIIKRAWDGITRAGRAVASFVTRSDSGLQPFEEIWAAIRLSSAGSANPYETNVFVRAAVKALAGSLGGLPVRLYDAGGNQIDDPNHPYLQLVEKPNEQQSGDELLIAMLTHFALDGIAYLLEPGWKPGMSTSQRRIYVASRSEIEPVRIGRTIVGYDYMPWDSGSRQRLVLSEVFALRDYHPRKRDDGLSGVSVSEESIEALNRGVKLFKNAIKNGAEVGAVFSTDATLTEEQREEAQQNIRKRYTGEQNAGNPVLLSGGVKLDRGVGGMKDMQWQEGLRLMAMYIATAFGMPPLFMNLMDQAQYNSAPIQQATFWTMTGLPLKGRIQGIVNAIFLRGDRGRLQLRLDTADVQCLREQEIATVVKASELLGKGFSGNEIIETWGFPLPKQPYREVPMIPVGQIPMDIAVAEARALLAVGTAPEGEPTPPAASTTPPKTPVTPTPEEKARAIADEILGLVRITATQNALHQRWLASWSPLTQRVATQVVRPFLERQVGDMRNKLAGTVLPYIPSPATPTESGKDDINDAIERIIFDLKAGGVEDNRIIAVMRPALSDGVDLGGKQIADEIGGATFTIHDPKTVKVIEQLATKVVRINADTRDQVRKTLTEGMRAGETLAELDARLNALLEETWQSRGYVIAQTEIHEALCAGRQQGMVQAGIDGKRWLTSGKASVRASHRECEQRSKDGIPIAENYLLRRSDGSGWEDAPYPGYTDLSAGNRINCSCVSVPKALAGKSDPAERLGMYTYADLVRERRDAGQGGFAR